MANAIPFSHGVAFALAGVVGGLWPRCVGWLSEIVPRKKESDPAYRTALKIFGIFLGILKRAAGLKQYKQYVMQATRLRSSHQITISTSPAKPEKPSGTCIFVAVVTSWSLAKSMGIGVSSSASSTSS